MSRAPAAEDPKNGNQQAVLRAIRRGNRRVVDVMRVTRLDEEQVRNAVRRLQDAGEVRRGHLGYDAIIKKVKSRCLLAEVWRGSTLAIPSKRELRS